MAKPWDEHKVRKRKESVDRIAELAEIMDGEPSGSDAAIAAMREGLSLFAGQGRHHLLARFPQEHFIVNDDFLAYEAYDRKQMGEILDFLGSIPVTRNQLRILQESFIAVDEGRKPKLFTPENKKPGPKAIKSGLARYEVVAAGIYDELLVRQESGRIGTDELRAELKDRGGHDATLRKWRDSDADHNLNSDQLAEATNDELLNALEKVIQDRSQTEAFVKFENR